MLHRSKLMWTGLGQVNPIALTFNQHNQPLCNLSANVRNKYGLYFFYGLIISIQRETSPPPLNQEKIIRRLSLLFHDAQRRRRFDIKRRCNTLNIVGCLYSITRLFQILATILHFFLVFLPSQWWNFLTLPVSQISYNSHLAWWCSSHRQTPTIKVKAPLIHPMIIVSVSYRTPGGLANLSTIPQVSYCVFKGLSVTSSAF